MTDTRIPIDIILNGRVYAGRYWSVVPRVGDLVSLQAKAENASRADARGRFLVEVERVVWGVNVGGQFDENGVDLYVKPWDGVQVPG